MFERFDKSARRAVVLAQEEARSLNHNYVGTEHLLLALIGDHGVAGQALTELGVTYDNARTHIFELIGIGITPVTGHIPFLPAARTVLQGAVRSALGYGSNHVHSGHVLHSMLVDDTSAVPAAEQTIIYCGATTATVLQHLRKLMTEPATPSPEPESGFVLSA